MKQNLRDDEGEWVWARMMLDPYAKFTQKTFKSDELEWVTWYRRAESVFGFHRFRKVFIHVSISWHIIPNISFLPPLRRPRLNDTARFIRFIVLLFRWGFFHFFLSHQLSLQLRLISFSSFSHDSFTQHRSNCYLECPLSST